MCRAGPGHAGSARHWRGVAARSSDQNALVSSPRSLPAATQPPVSGADATGDELYNLMMDNDLMHQDAINMLARNEGIGRARTVQDTLRFSQNARTLSPA